MNPSPKSRISLVVAAGILTTIACGTFSVTSPETSSHQIVATTEEANTDSANTSPYWVEKTDPFYGVRFALPCFWEVNFPEVIYPGGASYPIRNYTDAYVLSFPRGAGVWENGGIKIDMTFMDVTERNLPPGTSMEGFVDSLYQGNLDVLDYSSEEAVINGQAALRVKMESSYGPSEYYLFVVSDTVYLTFGAKEEDFSHPDVLGILNSIAIGAGVPVNVPEFLPGPPPIGLAAPCIPDYAEAVIQTPELLAGNTACGLDSFVSLETLIQNVQLKLFEKNTGSLHYDHFIHDPFVIAYWQSEGMETSPDYAATAFANQLYQAAEQGGLTFTTDRGEFPPLFGMPPETMFGPDVKVAEIVYSEGWGLDGLGAALLYFVEDECGGYYWHGLVFDGQHFDK